MEPLRQEAKVPVSVASDADPPSKVWRSVGSRLLGGYNCLWYPSPVLDILLLIQSSGGSRQFGSTGFL